MKWGEKSGISDVTYMYNAILHIILTLIFAGRKHKYIFIYQTIQLLLSMKSME